MRDFNGREQVKLSDVKEGDTLEVRAGAVANLAPGTYTLKPSIWGLRIDEDFACFYLEDWPKVVEPETGEEYLSGAYPVTPTQEPPVSNSPLSEDEMRAFFERMVTTIVGYSKQDGEIKALQSQVAEVNDKLSRMSEYVVRLEAQNQNLKDQVHAKDATIAERDTRISDLEVENSLYSEQVANLNSRISALEGERDNLRSSLEDMTTRSHDLERTIEAQSRELFEKAEQLRLVMEDRDNASRLYSETRDKLVEAEAKLRKVEEAIRSTQQAFQNVVNF